MPGPISRKLGLKEGAAELQKRGRTVRGGIFRAGANPPFSKLLTLCALLCLLVGCSKSSVSRSPKPTAENAFTEASYHELLENRGMMAVGKKQFLAKCARCHGRLGQGTVGPNLTDGFWIHSNGEFEGIVTAIRTGFPSRGMVGWSGLIPEGELVFVAAYVRSLRGTRPANGKGPQGRKILPKGDR